MKFFAAIFSALLLAFSANATTLSWTNTLGGSWHNATNWFPNVVPSTGDTALITNAGAYTVVITNSVSPNALLIGSPGSPTLVVDNYATLSCTNMIVTNNGTMTWSNSWINGALTILPGGQLNCAAPVNSYLYGLIITNQGTVTWSSGGLSSGGPPTTQIYNSGLWQITGNGTFAYGGGGIGTPNWINTGTLRKSGGTNTTSIDVFNFSNPGGLVDVQSGTLQFNGGATNLLSGAFSNTAPAIINLINGMWTDAGGIFTGTGTNTFNAGTFNLRTNVPTGLKFISGDVWVTGTNTFQNSGAITNLTIEGATLRGTNIVTGTLSFTSGSIPEKLTIATNGQLIISSTGNKLLYGATIINQGTVNCGGSISVGTTIISNGGLWQVTGDYNISYGGGGFPVWTNSGIIRKAAGSAGGYSQLDANFVNLPGALVESLTNRLILNGGTTSQFGGTFNAIGLIDLANGTWTDAGGVATGVGTNLGTFRKTGGSGIADNSAIRFFNQPGALVQVDSGTLQLPVGSTNFSGTLRLNGGTLNANGNFPVAGGTLDGAGTFGANSFTGGNISPGLGGAGQMNFSSGLNLNSNVTLVIDGTGPVAGVSYDALSVTGVVVWHLAPVQIPHTGGCICSLRAHV